MRSFWSLLGNTMTKAAILAVLPIAVGSLSSAAFACGKERWPVKVLGDQDRHLIQRSAKNDTVSALGSLDGPPNDERTTQAASDHRIAEQEKTTYVVKALLLGYRKETDGDFHLVLQDLNSHDTMIAEIPDPACIDDQTLSTKSGNFRQALVTKFGAPGKKTKRFSHPAPITIRGVGFFDIEHATEQDGKSANNLELHPVLGLSLTSQ